MWPTARGQGIGGCLHDSLLGAIPADRAWLVTNPHARAALALYDRRGWRHVATVAGPGGSGERMVMALSIPVFAADDVRGRTAP